MRPMVLAVVSGGEIPAALISARGEHGRAAERIAFAYLAQVRGEAAAFLADLLARRGTVARLLRLTHSPRAHRRARAAERLGRIASPEAERRPAARRQITPARPPGLTGRAGSAGRDRDGPWGRLVLHRVLRAAQLRLPGAPHAGGGQGGQGPRPGAVRRTARDIRQPARTAHQPDRAGPQQGGPDRREHAWAARPAVSRVRGNRRGRRLHRRHVRPPAGGIRARPGRQGDQG